VAQLAMSGSVDHEAQFVVKVDVPDGDAGIEFKLNCSCRGRTCRCSRGAG
jgi:hypothetical protein